MKTGEYVFFNLLFKRTSSYLLEDWYKDFGFQVGGLVNLVFETIRREKEGKVRESVSELVRTLKMVDLVTKNSGLRVILDVRKFS